ncbi:integrator complex subunit 6-like isoform X2 [Watersipora subatra]|uniref:integrator complex subunit 6-like isoform X2 n=1 Tax=Watersipora subatra TaxID=2589382 RepID=UPI00355B56CF
MTIILFLVDTSASMNQRTFLGTTILDVTKNAIETFQKIRSKNPNSKWDRLMLLTYDEPPGNIKGRCPFYIEPAVIISFSDGESMVTSNGIHKQLTLPMANGLVGSELTKEPFRWDQRVFGIVLKLPAVEVHEPAGETTFIPSAEASPIDSMCEVTGGRSYLVSNPRQLAQTLESLAQKAAMHGVVVNFEYIESPLSIGDEGSRSASPSPSNAWKSTKRMIYVKSSAQRGHSVGHWPLPESYWPDGKAKTLPARDAQPHIKFSQPKPPPAAHLMQILPMDVYELEASPLTQHILKIKGNSCYQTYIASSAKYTEHPFGFLQSHPSSQKVFLHIMPYNYPVLLDLLDDLRKTSMKATQKWKQEFDNFLRGMPGYYASYLRRALGRMGVHGVVSESLDSCLSFMVVSHLKQVRTKAKQEYETLVASVGQCVPPTEVIQVSNRNSTSLLSRQDFNELLSYTGGDYSSIASLQKELTKYESFPISVPRSNAGSRKTFNYKNPYDIARKDLLSQIAKLRATLLRPNGVGGSLLKDEHLHSVPVQRMGMYHEYLAKAPQPLRKLDTQPERMHTFGNPFKVNKNLMIDEADESMPGLAVAGGSSPKRSKREATESLPSSPARKKMRKPGPLPKHITLANRPTTPPLPPSTPPPIMPDTNGEEPELVNFTDSKEALRSQLVKPEDNGIIKQNGLASKAAALSPEKTSPTKFNAKVVRQNSDERAKSVGCISEIEQANERILQQLLRKEVKRPGKNHSELFKQLSNIQGSVEERRWILDRVIYEAYRFKRLSLADRLIKYKETISDAPTVNGASFPDNSATLTLTLTNASSLKPVIATSAQKLQVKLETAS